MKTLKLVALFFMSIIMGIANTSCSDEEELSKISFLEGTSLKMTIGSTETLHLVGEPSSIELPLCEWSCNNSEVLSVNSQGQITAKNVGNATVTASTKSGLMATCSVIVDPINVTEIKLSEESKNLLVGESFTITAEVVPSNATYPALIWTSSDNNIASVDNGKITAVGVGSCQIIVEDEKHSVKTVCQISVESIDVESINLDIYEKTIKIGESFSINATIIPENATYKGLSWSSTDTNIATVENGLVEAVGIGSCQIEVEDEKNSIKSICKVRVIPIDVEKIELSDKSVELNISESFTLTATILPDNATDKTIIWSSSDEKIATVNNGVITAISIGNCTITASDSNHNVVSNCVVSVTPIKVSGINILLEERTKLIGTKTVLDYQFYKVLPNNATNTRVSFKSSNPNVATVDESGCVTAISTGVAIITLETEDGHYSGQIKFTITDDPSYFVYSMNASKSSQSLSIINGVIIQEYSLTLNLSYDTTNLKFNAVYLYNKYNGQKMKSYSQNSAGYYSYRLEIINNRDPYLDYYYWVFAYEYNGQIRTVEKKAW